MRIVVFNGKHKLDIAHECLYFDASSITTEGVGAIVEKIRDFKPDLIFEEEKNDGVSKFTQIYQQLPEVPKAWWMIDAHTNLIDHIVYAKQFDWVFCAQSWFIPLVKREIRGRVGYLPLCHTQTMTEYQEMLKLPVKKDITFSFIGNIRSIHVDRERHVVQLLKMYPGFFARQSDYAKTLWYLRRSRVTFNCSLNNDLNFRVFEALACQAEIVTDEVTDVNAIYGLRPLLALYDKLNPEWKNLDLPDTFDGQTFIKSGHTLTHRMLQALEMIQLGVNHVLF